MSLEELLRLAQRYGLAHIQACDEKGEPPLDAEGEELAARFADVRLLLGDTDLGAGILLVSSRCGVLISAPSCAEFAQNDTAECPALHYL